MKTNDLRELITRELRKVCDRVYYEDADPDAMYPHIVYYLDFPTLDDASRDDIRLEVHMWTKSAALAENMADAVEETIKTLGNAPQETILPTFYLETRGGVPDPDKSIKHRVIRISVQNYER